MEEGEKENIRNSMMAAYKAVMMMVMVMVMVGLSRDQFIFGPWVVLTDGSTTHAHTLAFYLYM